MSQIKSWSTGSLGNYHYQHLNTDHVNTYGLDKNGTPGIEGFIDEDIVRAYSDNRPLINLLSNDEIINKSVDAINAELSINAILKKNKNDWRLIISEEEPYTDPEDFKNVIDVTPLKICKGVALNKSGTIANNFKKLVGFKRDDETTLWADDHIWNYDSTPTLDDPSGSYNGYYRAIYVDVPESSVPSNYTEYSIKIRQIHTSGDTYDFPIYTPEEFIIPYSSSVFEIKNELTNFSSDIIEYPGYDHYPDSYVQLQANNLGILEIGKDSKITKNIKRIGHKINASDFSYINGSYQAELKSDVFRAQKSAFFNRIENDQNFIRIIGGVKKYNETSRVYFDDHKTTLNVLLPIIDNRDFLGNQKYSFEISKSDQFSGATKVIEITSPETRAYIDFGLSIANPNNSMSLTPGTYDFNIILNGDYLVAGRTPKVISVTVTGTTTLNQLADLINSAFITNNVYAYARAWNDGGSWELRIYSKSSGTYSKIAINNTGISNGYLITALSATLGTPVNGIEEWKIYQDSASSGDHKEIVDGTSITTNNFSAGTIGRQLTEAMYNAGFRNFNVGLNNILDFNHACELYIESNDGVKGYQELGVTIPFQMNDSGLDPLTTYYFKLAIDGADPEEFNFTTSTDTTYSAVVNEINASLNGKASFEFTITNNLKFVSDSYGVQSKIQTSDGTTGTNLFGAGYPAAGFPPVILHSVPSDGSGSNITIKARQINTFSIFNDLEKKRAYYSHSDSKIYITPDTKTDIRDHVDTEHAYLSNTNEGRWSTHNDRVIQLDLSTHTSGWTGGSYITKIFSFENNNGTNTKYLIVANNNGEIFYTTDANKLYNEDLSISTKFTKLTHASLNNCEKVNNFFVYEDVPNSRRYLFILSTYRIFYSNIWSGLNGSTVFTEILCDTTGPITNLTSRLFSQIRDAIDWQANVGSSISNKYIIFVGDGSAGLYTNWIYAPILYALYDSTSGNFSWSADEIYKKSQINNISSIVKYDGWSDPEQGYQLFIANNANGPEIWAGNSQNNNIDIGGLGDDRFTRFSWVESNYENSNNYLNIDNDVSSINYLKIFDNRIFVGSTRASENVYGGFYSYSLNKLQKYFKRDSYSVCYDSSTESLYSSISNGLLANSDPCILKVSEELDDCRAQLISKKEIIQFNLFQDSSFRIILRGFNVGGIDYDDADGYNIIFNAESAVSIQDIVDAINGNTTQTPQGFFTALRSSTGVQVDLTPVIRARAITDYESSGNGYSAKYKILIESKTADAGEGSGHTSVTEETQSDCRIELISPTQGTSVLGTGVGTIEMDAGDISEANLQLIDWSDAECYQLKRRSSNSYSFGGNSYVDITSAITSTYKILAGSLRIKTNSVNELGFSQGRGKIITGSSSTGLLNNSTIYTFKVTFDVNGISIIDHVSFAGSSVQTITNLINAINTDLTGGIASLKTIGGTSEYCDIVITSLTSGDNSSVLIEPDDSGIYLFSKEALDTIPNTPIQGSTALVTSGKQTLGITWENADYFLVPDHPSTHQVRIYIPNGTTRIDTGDTIWLDFWEWKKLTKVAAKQLDGDDNLPQNPYEWTYEIEGKRIVLHDAPNIVIPQDVFFVDVKVKKILRKLDLGLIVPSSQNELSDEFNATQLQNLENSDIAISRPLARINALHYGMILWSTDIEDPINTDYSFFLPRLDAIRVTSQVNELGNRVTVLKGNPDPILPYVELPIKDQESYDFLYTIFINSQDYNQNNIIRAPYYDYSQIEKGRICIDGNIQYFKSENELRSTRGIGPLHYIPLTNKEVVNADYSLVKVLDPIGVEDYIKRDQTYSNLDYSKCIFLDPIYGSDSNDGYTKTKQVKTITRALELCSETRPNIIILKNLTLDIPVLSNVVISKTFPIRIIAEYIASFDTLSISSQVYIQGIKVTNQLRLLDSHNLTAKYCDLKKVLTDTSTSLRGIELDVQNSIIQQEGLRVDNAVNHNINGNINVKFSHVYISDDAQLLYFNPNTYSVLSENNFTFTNITNSKTSSLGAGRYVIYTPYSSSLNIRIINSVLPYGPNVNETLFNSDAIITITNSLLYLPHNYGTGSIVNDNSAIVLGSPTNEIDIYQNGALKSIARGDSRDSLAINFVDRKDDAGAFIEKRYERKIKEGESVSKTESLVRLNNQRVEYHNDMNSEHSTIWLRFKPKDSYQTIGVLFDSRYSRDYNTNSGTFNLNGSDFIQIVYDNKTYSTNYLTSDKYCFKLIVSNSLITTVAVIGPYFTADNNIDYNQWHEIGIVLEQGKTYNPKYDFMDISGSDAEDKNRIQTIIFTIWDRDISRIYAPKNNLFEDNSGTEISASNWKLGKRITHYFNLGGGWTASWNQTLSGNIWSTWTESSFDMLVDKFILSEDMIPVNVVKEFGEKEIIDLRAVDYNQPRLDDKKTTLIVHCNNSHPYSDNGVEPFREYKINQRFYEGIEQHAIAIEGAHPNLIPYGKINSKVWFDRKEAHKWSGSSVVTKIWDSENATLSPDSTNDLIATLVERDNNVYLDFINYKEYDIDSSIMIIASDSLVEGWISVFGTRIIVAYIKSSDNKAYFKTIAISGHAVSSEFPIDVSVTTDHLSICRGHNNNYLAVSYHDITNSKGYTKVLNMGTGADVYAKTEISNGDNISYISMSETVDRASNKTYTIFYVVATSNNLNYVMFSEDLSNIKLNHDTIISGQIPKDLQSFTLENSHILIKWKDYGLAGDDNVMNFSIKTNEGKDIKSNITYFATNNHASKTDDARLIPGGNIVFVTQDADTNDIYYHIYDGNGNILSQSSILRKFSEKDFTNFVLGAPDISREITVIGISSNEGWLVNSENKLPVGWYRDFTGTYDEFTSEVYETRTLFGNALHVRFNHTATANETGLFIANAETNDLSQFDGNTQTNGDINVTSDSLIHGSYGYKYVYDNTGNILYSEKTIAGLKYVAARLYIKVDSKFVIGGSAPYRIEIFRIGPGTDPVILELELNDPSTGGDGKFKLRAHQTASGISTTTSSVINYGVDQYIDIVYINETALNGGGYAIAVDGVLKIDRRGNDTSSLGNANYLSLGSKDGSTPTNGSKLIFDDVRVETSNTSINLVGEYTAGYGQGDTWSKTVVTNSSNKYYLSGVYFIHSGSIILNIKGSALDNEIVVKLYSDGTYYHETENDNLEDINIDQLNFNSIRNFAIGFTIDHAGSGQEIEIHIKTENSDVDARIDEFLVDNIKLEVNNWPTSIDADTQSLLHYPVSLKNKGNIFLRVRPEFLYNDASDHTLICGSAVDENGNVFITHELYYDNVDNNFKFTIRDRNGNYVTVENEEYGSAALVKAFTDLNERKTIICNWDIQQGLLSLQVNDEVYYNNFSPSTFVDFTSSIVTFIGVRPDVTAHAESLFDLIRIGEEALTTRECEIFFGKQDPFFRLNNTNIGNVIVNKINFAGVDAADEATIYTEVNSEGKSSIIIDVSNDFEDSLIIRQQGLDFVTFGSGHMQVNGIIKADVLEVNSTTTITTFDDHVTVRYGFSGTPTDDNDGYFEVERGTQTNSEIRYDESQHSWVFHNGINNNISIDDTHIGTWKSNANLALVSNGGGAITLSTGSSTDDGSGDGTQDMTDGIERVRISATEIVINENGLDNDFRIESDNEDHMFFIDSSSDRILIGRSITNESSGSLVVNNSITVQQGDDLSFGYIEFRNNSGSRSGYIGNGDGNNTWEIVSDVTTFNIQGDDFIIDMLGDITVNSSTFTLASDLKIQNSKAIIWNDDVNNAKLEYTDDALNYANESVNGIAQIADITCPADLARSLSGKYWNLNSVNNSYYVWYYIDEGQYEITQITCPADTQGSLSGKYWLLNSPNDSYYVWYNIEAHAEKTNIVTRDATESFGKYWLLQAPEGAFYVWYDNSTFTYADPNLPQRTGIRVQLTAGWTDQQVATQLASVLDARLEFAATASTNTVTITNATAGSVTDVADGPGDAISTITVQEQGTNASVDPKVVGRTGIRVDLTYSDTNTSVATKTSSAIALKSDFTTGVGSNIVTVTNVYKGAIDDAIDGTAGITVNVTQQGVTPSYDPGDLNSTGIKENTQITCVADVGGSLSGKFFNLNSPTGNYYVWYKKLGTEEVWEGRIEANTNGQQYVNYITFSGVNSNNQEIRYYVWFDNSSYSYADPKIPNAYGVRVEIILNETLTNINTKVATAINALDDFTADYNITTPNRLHVACVRRGSVTDPMNGMWETIPTVITQGANDSIDPKPAGKSSIPVIFTIGDSNTTIATKTNNTLNAMAEFNATSTNENVFIECAQVGPVVNATDGSTPTGFTITTLTNGAYSTMSGQASGTGIKVTILSGDSNTNIVTKTATAIDALSDFIATPNSNVVTITNVNKGEVESPSDGDSGITVNVTTAGDSGDSKNHGLGVKGAFSAHRIYNATWNDLAEGFEIDPENFDKFKPGFVYVMTESGLEMSSKRADKAVVGIYSDTYGFCLGSGGMGEISKYKIPICLTGKVPVWIREELEIGDLLVSDADGFATKATEEERKDRGIIIGKVIEASKDNKKKRIWILK